MSDFKEIRAFLAQHDLILDMPTLASEECEPFFAALHEALNGAGPKIHIPPAIVQEFLGIVDGPRRALAFRRHARLKAYLHNNTEASRFGSRDDWFPTQDTGALAVASVQEENIERYLASGRNVTVLKITPVPPDGFDLDVHVPLSLEKIREALGGAVQAQARQQSALEELLKERAELERREDELKLAADRLEGLQKANAEKQAVLDALRERLGRREEAVAREARGLEDESQRQQTLATELESRERSIAARQAELKRRQDELDRRMQHIAQRESGLSRDEQDLLARGEALRDKAQAAEALRTKLEELASLRQATEDSLENLRSTAPGDIKKALDATHQLAKTLDHALESVLPDLRNALAPLESELSFAREWLDRLNACDDRLDRREVVRETLAAACRMLDEATGGLGAVRQGLMQLLELRQNCPLPHSPRQAP